MHRGIGCTCKIHMMVLLLNKARVSGLHMHNWGPGISYWSAYTVVLSAQENIRLRTDYQFYGRFRSVRGLQCEPGYRVHPTSALVCAQMYWVWGQLKKQAHQCVVGTCQPAGLCTLVEGAHHIRSGHKGIGSDVGLLGLSCMIGPW